MGYISIFTELKIKTDTFTAATDSHNYLMGVLVYITEILISLTG